jgi:hypothetical protein
MPCGTIVYVGPDRQNLVAVFLHQVIGIRKVSCSGGNGIAAF